MAITIERQAPERGLRGVEAAPAGQCCCCCCCCLHTVGGAIGALTALNPTLDPATLEAAELPVSAIHGKHGTNLGARYSAAGLYWAMVAVVAGLTCAGFFAGSRHRSETGESALLVAMVLPAIQLGASVITAIILLCSKRVGVNVRLRHLGKITVRAFCGALIGGLLMLPLFTRC